MASGLPVVVRDQGGMTDLVVDGKSGFVCDGSESMAAVVQRLRDDPALCAAMSRCARQTAEQHTWRRVMSELEGHYSHALTLAARLAISALASTQRVDFGFCVSFAIVR